MAKAKTAHNTFINTNLDKDKIISSINVLQSSMKRNKLD